MEKDPQRRLTCKQALIQDWIAGDNQRNINIAASVQEQIRRTQITGRWRKVFNATRALRRMNFLSKVAMSSNSNSVKSNVNTNNTTIGRSKISGNNTNKQNKINENCISEEIEELSVGQQKNCSQKSSNNNKNCGRNYNNSNAKTSQISNYNTNNNNNNRIRNELMMDSSNEVFELQL